MTVGKRAGFLTKAELASRLSTRLPDHEPIDPVATQAKVILGHAVFHKVISDFELNETIERTETTIPCYLFTHVEDPLKRHAIEEYVVAASQLYRRGTIIANLVAIQIAGGNPGNDGAPNPRFDPVSCEFGDLADLLIGGKDIRNSAIKQAFLPERWPSDSVPRNLDIQAVLDSYGNLIPRLPDWLAVMKATGWDNAINRMAKKFLGNINVHTKKNLLTSVIAYMSTVTLHDEETRGVITDTVKGRLRPLVIHDEDMEMVMNLRRILGVREDEVTWYTPKETTVFSRDVLLLHIFLVRHGNGDRSYLPVASRGRKYCYLDTKITRALFAEAQRRVSRQRNAAGVKRPRRIVAPPDADPPAEDDPSEAANEHATVSVGELLGITEREFNSRRKTLRRTLRLQYRKGAAREAPGKKRKRLQRLARRWANIGCGHMPPGVRVDSVETDGVGLRLCVKTPIDLRPYIIPAPQHAPVAAVDATQQQAKRQKKGNVKGLAPPPYFEPVDPVDDGLPKPIVVALDNGRAKIFSAAITKSPIKKPESKAFTRRTYYFEMGYHRNRRWELDRMAGKPAVNAALASLSDSGGIHNSDDAKWRAYFAADRDNYETLHAEYVIFKERALWRMRMFRWKRRSLDRATGNVLYAATHGENVNRPLVFAMGDADFPCTGPGELPAPTSAITVAFRRALARVSRSGRQVILFSIDEFKTTMCCCGCGSVTTRPQVSYMAKDGTSHMKASNRLRACTSCETTVKLRDRDVQAARNITWLAYCLYYGLDRPEYMSRH